MLFLGDSHHHLISKTNLPICFWKGSSHIFGGQSHGGYWISNNNQNTLITSLGSLKLRHYCFVFTFTVISGAKSEIS